MDFVLGITVKRNFKKFRPPLKLVGKEVGTVTFPQQMATNNICTVLQT